MTSLKFCRTARAFVATGIVGLVALIGSVAPSALIAPVALSGRAEAAAIVTTAGGSDEIVIYPTPNAESPNPAAIKVSNLPAGAHPSGVSCVDADTCLVADSGNFRIFVVKVSTRSIVDTIGTGSPINYSGGGTIAVNPAKTHALAIAPFFLSGQLTVIAAPFTSASPITTLSLTTGVGGGGTQGIAFGPGGQAFICTGGSITVVNPPYTTVAFSMAVPGGCSELAMTPDGNTLFAPQGKTVNIFSAPFTAGSTPAARQIPDAGGLAGAAVTADGTKALITDTNGEALWVVSAPFSAGSAVEKITLPPGLPALRQVAVSSDVTDPQLAILTGGGGLNNPHLAFVRAPFTAAGATAFDVFIEGGIGSGGVAFAGLAGSVGPPPPPCGPITASMSLGARAIRLPRAEGDPVLEPLVASILPSSRSVRVGCPATAFVTIINAGANTALKVGIEPTTPLPADFLYQTTDPATNALTGTPNTPVDIAPNLGFQTYVIAFTPRAAFAPTDITFDFGGLNTAPVQTLVGTNTFLLSASTTNVPDIVALTATPTNDGIVDLPAATNVNAFAVASVNVGLGASITVSADTGGVVLPITILVCETGAGGTCVQPAATSVTTFINGGATPTFAFFVSAQGFVPFDPAIHRIFTRFKDGGGITRGSSSVAVRSTN